MLAKQWLLYFLKLGATGFGGPMAIIAQMHRDLVENKKIVEEKEFSQSLALIKTLPGPVAIQLIAFISYRNKGFWIAILSSILFVIPSFVLMVLLAIFYKDIRGHSVSSLALDGMQAGALALVVEALFQLLKSYFKNLNFWIFGSMSVLLLIFFHASEVFVIFLSAGISVLIPKIKLLFNNHYKSSVKSIPVFELLSVCLKAGGLAFGTGIAIIPMMQKDFVERLGWVTQQQFLDAIAFGQLTPGPISVTVTFVGYLVAGFWGAVIATFGIFFPGVFNMTTWFPRVYDWFSKQKWVKDFVLGAISAIAAGILVALYQMTKVMNTKALLIAFAVIILNRLFKLQSWLLILLSAMAGWLIL
jgi:chromate transporter